MVHPSFHVFCLVTYRVLCGIVASTSPIGHLEIRWQINEHGHENQVVVKGDQLDKDQLRRIALQAKTYITCYEQIAIGRGTPEYKLVGDACFYQINEAGTHFPTEGKRTENYRYRAMLRNKCEPENTEGTATVMLAMAKAAQLVFLQGASLIGQREHLLGFRFRTHEKAGYMAAAMSTHYYLAAPDIYYIDYLPKKTVAKRKTPNEGDNDSKRLKPEQEEVYDQIDREYLFW